jgi:hypothetical protein
MSRRVATLLPVAFLVTLSADGVTDGGRSPAGRGGVGSGPLRLIGGPAGGVYQVWAQSFARRLALLHPPGVPAVRPTAGSGANLQMIRREPMTVGLAAIDFVTESGGAGEVTGAPLSALARVYDDYLHLLVRDDGPIRTSGGLSGRSVAVGPPGSGTALIADRLLACGGLPGVRPVPTGLVQGLDGLAAGWVDGLLWSGGLPTSSVSRAWTRHELRLVPLDAAGTLMRSAHGDVYRDATIPAHTYGNVAPVPTFAVANLLMGRSDLPADVVVRLLSVAFASVPDLAAQVPGFNAFDNWTAIETQPISLHAAAQSYYGQTKP